MDITRLKSIAYAEGFIEEFVTKQIEKLEGNYKTQVEAMWQVLASGLNDLRRENGDLLAKLDTARNMLT